MKINKNYRLSKKYRKEVEDAAYVLGEKINDIIYDGELPSIVTKAIESEVNEDAMYDWQADVLAELKRNL